MFVLSHTNRYSFKNVLGNNGRYRIGNHDILVCVFPDISTIGKNASERVFIEAVALGCADAPSVQILDDVDLSGDVRIRDQIVIRPDLKSEIMRLRSASGVVPSI